VLIVGGGLGGLRVAEQLRQQGHQGEIAILGAEAHEPYDRPPLSKQVLRGERDSTTFGGMDRLDVCWNLGVRAVSLDTANTQVRTSDGVLHTYDSLVLAPGGRPRTLPGVQLGAGVHVLRTIDDARALRTSVLSSGRLIVIGAGFIGCEVAASARHMGIEVDLVEGLTAPLIRVLGPLAASKVTELHVAHGVRMHMSARVNQVLRDADGCVQGLQMGDGSVLEGRDVVVGIGIEPDLEWMVGSGLELGDGIRCDSNGRTNVPNVYALGDAAQWWHTLAGEHRRIEHWTTTADQAAVVASTILSTGSEIAAGLQSAPYFWSDQYDTKIQGVGFINPADDVEEVTVRGHDVLLYSRDEVLRGVIGFSIPSAVMRTKALIERGAALGEAREMLVP
jgi:3-phenylpropionate/trans-cinnamate dioxygenase ferredoxin reductase subunit